MVLRLNTYMRKQGLHWMSKLKYSGPCDAKISAVAECTGDDVDETECSWCNNGPWYEDYCTELEDGSRWFDIGHCLSCPCACADCKDKNDCTLEVLDVEQEWVWVLQCLYTICEVNKEAFTLAWLDSFCLSNELAVPLRWRSIRLYWELNDWLIALRVYTS